MRAFFRSLLSGAVPAAALWMILTPPALAEFPCENDEVRAATVPARAGWTKGEPTRDLTQVDEGWAKLALGLDWRLLRTDMFAVVAVPAERGAPLFFIQRWDDGWCGSGGCTMTLYDCTIGEGEVAACETVWSGWKQEVRFTGSGEAGHPDFIVGDTDLFTWREDEYGAVCNVTVLAE